MKFSSLTTRWLVIGLASAFAFGCGGGGGGGGDDVDTGGTAGGGGDTGDVVVLPVYAYELVSIPDDPVRIVAWVGDGELATVVLGNTDILGMTTDPSTVFGTYTVADGTFTIAEGSEIFAGDGDPGDYAEYEDFQLEVTTTWVFPPDGPPTQGAFTRASFLRSIVVEVTPEGMLRLAYSDPTPINEEVILSFDELDEAVDDPDAPFWLEWGVFAYQVFGDLMPELASYGVGGFDLIVDELADASPVTAACDAFSSIGWVPAQWPGVPGTFPDQGSVTFTWLDDAADGRVGPGDSFEMASTFCLAIVEPITDAQIMLDGLVSLNSYTEVIENNTLVRIGFEGTSPADRPGGLHFDDLHRFEVFGADAPGGSVAIVHLPGTINGRMTLVFEEPVQ